MSSPRSSGPAAWVKCIGRTTAPSGATSRLKSCPRRGSRILTGTRDLLSPDAVRFAELARAADVEVDLIVENGMFHAWVLIDMPEARRARDRIVAYLSREPGQMRAEPGAYAPHPERRGQTGAAEPARLRGK